MEEQLNSVEPQSLKKCKGITIQLQMYLLKSTFPIIRQGLQSYGCSDNLKLVYKWKFLLLCCTI